MIDTFIKIRKDKMRNGFNVWIYIAEKIKEWYNIDIDDMEAHNIENTKVIKLDDAQLHDYARTHKCEPREYEYFRVIVKMTN